MDSRIFSYAESQGYVGWNAWLRFAWPLSNFMQNNNDSPWWCTTCPCLGLFRSRAIYHSLQWRHNERECTSNHQPHDCLLSCLFRKYQSSVSLAFVRGIHPWLVNSPHKGPMTRKMFPFDDVIMDLLLQYSWRRGHWPDKLHQSTFSSVSFMIYSLVKTSICYPYMPSLTSERRTRTLILHTQTNLISQWTGIDRYRLINGLW